MADLPNYRLMIPGPVEVDPELLAEMGRPMVAHYGPEWTRFFNETLDFLKRVFRTERGRVFPLVGPGTSGLDAAIGNTIGDGKEILVASNGFFGERFRQIATSYTGEARVHTVTAPIGQPINPDDVDRALRDHPEVAAVAVVHCETSTGLLNPLKEIAAVARRHDALTIIDAITSLGGVELRFDAWGLDVVVSSTQKGLGLPPGIAPTAVSERAWRVIEDTHMPGWYLDFTTWQTYMDEWGTWHPHPVTMPSGLVRALHEALGRMLAEGMEAVWTRHRRAAQMMGKGLGNLGFELLPPEADAAPTVTAAYLPEGVDAHDLIDRLKDRHSLQISGALGDLNAIRIGHMAYATRPSVLIDTLLCIEDALRSLGAPVEAGQALRGLQITAEAGEGDPPHAD